MPLALVPPRQGRSPHWRIRGTYLGRYVDRSAGTPDKAVARQLLAKIRRDIERGELAEKGELTFAAAMLAYIQAGGEERFLKPIADHFGPRTLARELDQTAIDACAAALYPRATPATRNRQVYSPVSAILRHVGIRLDLRRPKGSRGRQLVHWLTPPQAKAAIDAARAIDGEFAAFLIFLLYTGARLSEALALEWRHVDLGEATALSPRTKTEEPRLMHLPPIVVAELANLKAAKDEAARLNPAKRRPAETLDQIERRRRLVAKVFRFQKSGRIYHLLRQVSDAAGVKIGHHMLRHTWATWMRRYGKLTREDLLDTGAWRDVQSIRRYDHADTSEAARAADLLPDVTASPNRKAG